MPTYVPPPKVMENNVTAWAHCSNPRCDGNGQQSVPGVRVTSEWTIGSRGGGGAGFEAFAQIVENTNEYVRFADPDDEACPTCSKPREISEQERPVIPVITGFPQDGLLGAPKFDPGVVNTQADQKHAEEMAAMRAQMTEMAAQVAKLTGEPPGDD